MKSSYQPVKPVAATRQCSPVSRTPPSTVLLVSGFRSGRAVVRDEIGKGVVHFRRRGSPEACGIVCVQAHDVGCMEDCPDLWGYVRVALTRRNQRCQQRIRFGIDLEGIEADRRIKSEPVIERCNLVLCEQSEER